MKIDPKTPIAGLRPAVLKSIFRRREFTVATFAEATGVAPDEATAKLQELADLGWVKKDTPVWWVTTDLGHRLAATPLIPPIRVTRARELVPLVVAAAEAINADPSYSYVVKRLILFGSLLEAPVDGWVGDVDLAFELERRDLAPDKKAAVWQEELQSAPTSHAGVMIYSWPSERARRRLKKVHRSVSLHPMDDLAAIGAVGHQIWNAGEGTVTLPW